MNSLKAHIYIVLLLLLGNSMCFSQGLKFDYQYDINNANSFSNTVFKYGDRYCVFGLCSNSLTGQQNGLSLLVTDTFGIEVSQQQFYHPDNNLFFSNSVHNFVQLQKNYVIFSGHIQVAFEHRRGALVKFNLSTKDTAWVKTYTEPGDTTKFLTSTFLADSSIIVFGERYYQVGMNGFTKAFIMKIDKDGNYKWHKYISNWVNHYYWFQKIIKLNESDFVVAGTKLFDVCNPQGFIMRIDTNGNKQYELGLSGINFTYVHDMIQLSDNSFLIGGSHISFNDCNNNKSRRFLYKFNGSNGLKIKSQIYNNPTISANSFLTLSQTQSGKIWAGGVTGNPGNQYQSTGDFTMFNSNLDSLQRVVLTEFNSGDNSVPYSLLNTKDGGFVTAIYHTPNQSQQKNRLLKADSTGCYSQIFPNVIVNSGTLCLGNSFTLVPFGAQTYSFSSGTPIVTPTISTSFSVIGTNSLGCVSATPAISNVTVLALPLPTVSASTSNTLMCIGETVTLTASGADTYTWNSLDSGPEIYVSPISNTVYIVTGKNTFGCHDMVTINQLVDPCAGMEEVNENSANVNIFPNPFKDNIQINIAAQNLNKLFIRISNTLGQTVKELREINENNQIQLTEFSAGIYFVQIINSGKVISSKKIVKE
ncbi:MAG: T9SS type A sorting domain-containing protein [Sphingobacteriaceae bacterium]|nr:T9SS type A sorting domain-containing protein [Sphingobacteriaceae bacterium]